MIRGIRELEYQRVNEEIWRGDDEEITDAYSRAEALNLAVLSNHKDYVKFLLDFFFRKF